MVCRPFMAESLKETFHHRGTEDTEMAILYMNRETTIHIKQSGLRQKSLICQSLDAFLEHGHVEVYKQTNFYVSQP